MTANQAFYYVYNIWQPDKIQRFLFSYYKGIY